MLVISRKKHQSVLIGDEVKLTVEGIHDSDGQHIRGGTVRLGFDSPRYITIHRTDWVPREPRVGPPTGRLRADSARAGQLVDLGDAEVHLRIELPGRVPVHHNGSPTTAELTRTQSDQPPGEAVAVCHLTCRVDDHITICHNINIAALALQRFEFAKEPAA